MLRECRRATRRAVIQEQYYWSDDDADFDFVVNCLRDQSLLYSKLGARFAKNLAKVDRIDALFFKEVGQAV